MLRKKIYKLLNAKAFAKGLIMKTFPWNWTIERPDLKLIQETNITATFDKITML